MSTRISNGFYSQQSGPMSSYTRPGPNLNSATSYNANIVIPQGAGPPPPMLTQTNPNIQPRQVLHQRGQYAMQEKDITSLNAYPENLAGKRPMTIVDPLYDQHIIKPPKANVTQGRIPDIEFISSEDRNFRLYPKESDYRVLLKDEYKNVTSVTLFNASIPNTAFLVGERNNRVYIQESFGQTITIEMPVGDYTPTLLQAALQSALNQGGSSNYTVTLNALQNKFEIASDLSGGDHIFNFLFYGGSEKFDQGSTRPKYIARSIGRVLGFPRKDFLYASGIASTSAGSATVLGNFESKYTTELAVGEIIYLEEIDQVVAVTTIISDTEFTISAPAVATADEVKIAKGTHNAPNKFDLSSEPFIVLEIPELENVRGNATHIDRSFAVIPMVFPHNTKNFVVSPASGIPPYKKYFNPPLPRLDRFTVRFRDIDGNLVNFNGIENFLEFRILTLNAPGFYDPGSTN